MEPTLTDTSHASDRRFYRIALRRKPQRARSSSRPRLLHPETLQAWVRQAQEAIELLSARDEELLGRGGPPAEPAASAEASKAHEVVALGASVGANSRPLLHLHIGGALQAGLTFAQVEAALKMAEHVQLGAGEMTAEKATRALEELDGTVGTRRQGTQRHQPNR